MIGGQIIIPIRGATGQKLNITTSLNPLKAGTSAKILRAIEMQKELVFEDLYINGVYFASCSVCGGNVFNTTNSKYYFSFRISTIVSGTLTRYDVFVNLTDNQIYYSVVS